MAIDLDFMNKFLEEHPVPAGKEKSNGHKAQPGRRNNTPRGGHKGTIEEQDAFLERNHIGAGPRRQTDNGGSEREIPCPNGPHQASVYRYEDGTFGFQCFHTSNKCHEMHWSDFAEMVEPGYKLKQEQAEMEALKAEIDDAMGKSDVSALYDLAEQVAQLPTKDREMLCTTIKNTMAKCKDFSWSSFKKLIGEASPPRTVARRTNGGDLYVKTSKGMILHHERWGDTYLSNFAATIVADVTTDDGAEKTRGYAIRAELNGRQFGFEVKASEFASCNWLDHHLGAHATIGVGDGIKSHLVNSIKTCSEDIEEVAYYAHTGWRANDGQMDFLHAGKSQCHKCHAMSHSKNECDIEVSKLEKPVYDGQCHECHKCHKNMRERVKLEGNLKGYELPEPPENPIPSVLASLEFPDITKDTLTMPIYCAIWRAVLGDPDFGLHLAGPSGRGKTALVVPAQQHFGAGMSEQHLPGSWISTDNALEMQMFQAKDVIFVCDDFKPVGAQNKQDALHAKADRLFRAVGNHSSRSRLSSTLELRPERPPRCFLISTGEDIPKGESLQARAIVLMMDEKITEVGTPTQQRLEKAQKDASSGLYAQAMSGYIAWLAPRIKDIQAQLPSLIANERADLRLPGHARTGTNMANLIVGMKYFLEYATEVGAITDEQSQGYLARCRYALIQVASDAAQENTHVKPSEQWKRNLIAAINAKTAHLVTASGDNPGIEYGWAMTERQVEHDGLTTRDVTYRGGGKQIGWIDGDDIYLQPEASYQAVREFAARNGDDITTTSRLLHKFLAQDNLLASNEMHTRHTPTVRRKLEGSLKIVLHLKKNILFPETPSPSEKHDICDIHDIEPSDVASQAVSKVPEVLPTNVTTHDTKHDIPPKNMTTPIASVPVPSLSPEALQTLISYEQAMIDHKEYYQAMKSGLEKYGQYEPEYPCPHCYEETWWPYWHRGERKWGCAFCDPDILNHRY